MNTLKKPKKGKYLLIAVAILVFFGLTASSCDNGNESTDRGGKTAQNEQDSINRGFNRLSNTQQVPEFDWSQERQTVIDVETIRATGATSTTAFYLEGVGMIGWCPSAGAPVPGTYQLSGTKQWVDIPDDESKALYDIDQGEPTGVYIGPSTGTWTLCLDDNGKKFAKYWEGYVDSTVGIVASYPANKRVIVDELTFKFTDKPA